MIIGILRQLTVVSGLRNPRRMADSYADGDGHSVSMERDNRLQRELSTAQRRQKAIPTMSSSVYKRA